MTTSTPRSSTSEKPIAQPVATPPSTGNVDVSGLPFLAGDFAFVDTETTGVDSEVDRIVEIAIVRYRDGQREVFHTLVDPEVSIPPTASAVHHITDRTIAEAKERGCAPTFAEISEKVKEMLVGAHVYGHNAPFDEGFVDGHLGERVDPKKWICTVRLSRHLFKNAPAHGNQVLRYWLQTEPESAGLGPHRAIDDVFVSLETTFHLWQLAAAVGAKTHDDLLELSNRPIITTTMNFGKHAGKDFCDVPGSYFEWCLGPDGLKDMDDDLRASMNFELMREGRKEDDVRIKGEAASNVVPAELMLFGKNHYGKPMGDIPLDYLEWMESVGPKCTPEVRAGAMLELNRRRGNPGVTNGVDPDVGKGAGGAAHISAGAKIAEQTYVKLLGIVQPGSSDSQMLEAIKVAKAPAFAFTEYLKDFASLESAEYIRVSQVIGGAHGAWMLKEGGINAASANNASNTPHDSAAHSMLPGARGLQTPVAEDGPGRKSLFGKRQADPDADDAGPAPELEAADSPFESAPAHRRMRPH